ncbi:MAG: LPXTG cell wall anchor domain-containing protein [Acidimicrobiales bacterium]
MNTYWRTRGRALGLTLGIGGALLLGISPTARAGAGEPESEPPGNAGTVKIHESTTPDADRRDEPKVCEFRIVGFGFPEDSHIELSIEGQGGDNVAGTDSWDGTIESGDLSAEGDWAIAGPSLTDGMYKLSADNTTAPGEAKHKVFKVDCSGDVEGDDTGGTTDTGTTDTGGDDTGTTTGSVQPNTLEQPASVQGAQVLGETLTRPQTLPRTGSGTDALAVIGGGLVLTGAGVLVARRRFAH